MGKQWIPRSDCSSRSSLIRVFTVCYCNCIICGYHTMVENYSQHGIGCKVNKKDFKQIDILLSRQQTTKLLILPHIMCRLICIFVHPIWQKSVFPEAQLQFICSLSFQTLIALRAIGNAGFAYGAIPTLTACMKYSANPTEIRLSAIEAFRRMPCDAYVNMILNYCMTKL